MPARLGVVRAPLASRMAAAAEQTPEQELQAKLVERLQAEFVSAVDLSDGCGSKFQCVIISTLFEGKPLLVRARDAAMSRAAPTCLCACPPAGVLPYLCAWAAQACAQLIVSECRMQRRIVIG